jgi:hypothetical protein
MWTPLGPPELFLLEMNLLNVNTSLFWTVDTFSVSSAVNNLSKVNTCWSSPYFFRSVKVDMYTSRENSFPLFVSMLSYFTLNLLSSRDMTWEFYFSMVYRSSWNKTAMSYRYSVINLIQSITVQKQRGGKTFVQMCIWALIWLVWRVRCKDKRIDRE